MIPERILHTGIAHLLRIQILRLVIRQETLPKSLKLRPKLIHIVDPVTGQPLGSGVVFDEDLRVDSDVLAQGLETVLGVDVLEDPDAAGVLLNRGGDLLVAAEL